MSSNSSSDRTIGLPPAETVEELLTSAIGVLARERPDGFAHFTTRGHGLLVDIEIDAERFAVDFLDKGSVNVSSLANPVSPLTKSADVLVRSNRLAIHDVLTGHAPLTSVIADDRLEVVGPVDAVIQMHDSLVAFMQAAVRCPSMSEVLRRFGDTAETGLT